MVLVLLPVIIMIMLRIRKHYDNVTSQLQLTDQDRARGARPSMRRSVAIVPVASIDRASLRAIDYARHIASDVTTVHVTDDPAEASRMQEEWDELNLAIPLVIIESPYRETVGPLVNYIEELQEHAGGLTVSVVLPEFVPAHLYELLLHNQTALRLKLALWTHRDVVVVNVPYHLRR